MMSTNDYLASLDFDQLIYARDRVEQLINNKKREKKRIVWCVEDNRTRLAFYPNDMYVDAAKFLLKKAMENASDAATHPNDKRLRIDCIHAFESEYGEYEAIFEPAAKDVPEKKPCSYCFGTGVLPKPMIAPEPPDTPCPHCNHRPLG